MNRHLSIGLVAAVAAISASSTVACSQGADPSNDAVSSAASPMVQQAGVKRFRALVSGNVTHVELLDEGGHGIGTLDLTTEGARAVHATQTVFGRTLDARWTDTELTFTRRGKGSLTVRAGETRRDDADLALFDATDDLSIALGVARDAGAFSLVDGEPGSTQVRPLDLGTGSNGESFTGLYWAWGTGAAALSSAYYGSQVVAYNACTAVHSTGCLTYDGAVMTTSCTTGTFTTSCSATIVPKQP